MELWLHPTTFNKLKYCNFNKIVKNWVVIFTLQEILDSVPDESRGFDAGLQVIKAFDKKGRIEGQNVFLSNGKMVLKDFDVVNDCQNMSSSVQNYGNEFVTLTYDSIRKSFRKDENGQ